MNSYALVTSLATVAIAQNATTNRFNFRLASNQAIANAGFFDMHKGYGCWCYFGGEHYHDHLVKGQAKGVPLDVYDEACQKLLWGYECAYMDAQANRGTKCIPWTVRYEVVDFDANSDIKSDCAAANAGTAATDVGDQQCAIDACAVETYFVATIKSLNKGLGGIFPTQAFHHDLGINAAGFDKLDMCPGIYDDAQVRERTCCGTSPLRRPYNTLNSFKCCDGN